MYLAKLVVDGGGVEIVLEGPGAAAPFKACLAQAQEQVAVRLPGAVGLPGEWVEESWELTLAGTPASIYAGLSQLESCLLRARSYAGGIGDYPVALLIQPAADQDAWQSLVLDGRVESLGRGAEDVRRGQAGFRLRLRRLNCWEKTTTYQVLLSSSAVTRQPTAAVYNHDDSTAGHDSYVDIAASDVNNGGDLPSPAALIVKNTYSAANGLDRLYVGLNANGGPGTAAVQLEAEAAAGGTTLSDAACSGGSYKSVSLTGSAAVKLLTWTLTPAQARAAAGYPFRFFLRQQASFTYTDLLLRLSAAVPGLTNPVFEGPWVLGDPTLDVQDLGQARIPPYPYLTANLLQSMELQLWGRKDTAGTYTLNLDYLAVLAAESFRTYRAINPLPYNWYLGDDGIKRRLTSWDSNGFQLVTHAAYGAPLELWPNQAQRLQFLMVGANLSSAVDRTLQVYLYYRPRRRVI